MRVAADELGDQSGSDVVDAERAPRLGEPGVEHDLQEHVAELVGEVVVTAVGAQRVHRVDHLVRLLHEVAEQALVRLLRIPGTAAGPQQAVHDRDDLPQSVTVGHAQPSGCAPSGCPSQGKLGAPMPCEMPCSGSTEP